MGTVPVRGGEMCCYRPRLKCTFPATKSRMSQRSARAQARQRIQCRVQVTIFETRERRLANAALPRRVSLCEAGLLTHSA